jgi:hypothetical protein
VRVGRYVISTRGRNLRGEKSQDTLEK